jgi:hypothetical protein
MLINYIYDQWSYTGLTGIESALNKPATKTGQTTTIEFRPGIKDDFKQLQVLALQGRTVVVDHKQTGWKREEMTTQVLVTTAVKQIGRDDTGSLLRKMDQEIGRICGMYRQANQTTGDMRGIKDLIYEGNDRIYGPKDAFDKSDWETRHSILMWYELAHGEQ